MYHSQPHRRDFAFFTKTAVISEAHQLCQRCRTTAVPGPPHGPNTPPTSNIDRAFSKKRKNKNRTSFQNKTKDKPQPPLKACFLCMKNILSRKSPAQMVSMTRGRGRGGGGERRHLIKSKKLIFFYFLLHRPLNDSQVSVCCTEVTEGR